MAFKRHRVPRLPVGPPLGGRAIRSRFPVSNAPHLNVTPSLSRGPRAKRSAACCRIHRLEAGMETGFPSRPFAASPGDPSARRCAAARDDSVTYVRVSSVRTGEVTRPWRSGPTDASALQPMPTNENSVTPSLPRGPRAKRSAATLPHQQCVQDATPDTTASALRAGRVLPSMGGEPVGRTLRFALRDGPGRPSMLFASPVRRGGPTGSLPLRSGAGQ
jgi:hypothetical protein